MEDWIEALSLILKIFTAYTAVISIFFLLPRRKIPRAEARTRFAVLLAARNEEAVIGRTVQQLLDQHYPRELFDVYVIPNNCTDDTEGVARRAGAQILPCLGTVRNKGDALHGAFAALKQAGYDAYCVFDADNLVDPDFLARMNDAFCAGAQAAKGKQTAMNPHDAWISGCYDLYFENFNLLYNRPRGNLGLSAKLVGTGFAVSQALMDRLGGWNTETMAEDAEFAAQCAMAGVRVWWVPDALTYDEEPVTFRQSLVQRRRWCSGVMLSAPAVAAGSLPELLLLLGLRRVSLYAYGPGAGFAAWALGGGTGGTSGKLAGLGVELGVLLGRHDLDGTGPGLGGTAKTAPSVEVHFALSIVHCFLVSPTYSGRFPEDQGLEAHCPPWSDGPAAGELGAVSDRGWGERRAYYDHGRAAAPGQGRGGAVSAAGLRRPDHPKPAVPAGA